MKRARHRGMRGAWALLAWAAMLMFAAQPLTAQAMVTVADGRTITVELCSAHGGGKITLDRNGAPVQKQIECEKCPTCLGAPTALTTAPPLVRSVSFEYRPAVFSDGRGIAVAAIRAPPRPPGQGPPALNA